MKTKNPALLQDLYCLFLAGKKVQISNDFAKDLGEILDFIDRFRPEIDAIGKEPEISEK
ncbi:MAG: hypothetical protein J0L87_07320 [Bacteroidetes bacterium]|nr:hypothetical protein [Bacteroidota bacterium]